ncbi:G430095P16Rik [Phodopus roborovskii]|uniref:G430095P16Rik protein n=1 Tax=Phodopus roborovskii TaxID=109678 RepID=A0AAU9ZNS0_PHORO|nr:G430095P16Rik [Phodopus roborovskii]
MPPDKKDLTNCDGHLHTCIHVIGPSTRLAAAGCWGAACPRIEHIINWALHLAVIDGLGALGGAEEEGRQVCQSPSSHQELRPRYCTAGECQLTEALQFLE